MIMSHMRASLLTTSVALGLALAPTAGAVDTDP
jgi:hypothetical protein